MTLFQQDTWHGLIAAYLFLGGLGGGVMALGAFLDIFMQANDEEADRRPALFAALAGLVALGVGSVILVLDLEQPLAAIYALSNFSSWITWGILFISLYMVTGFFYGLPYFQKKKVMTGFQRSMGISAMVFGLLVAVYTGFLLSSSVGIAFWNTPALPLLFVVSGLSTGAALLMLYLTTLKGSEFGKRMLALLERIDLGLVALELMILFAFVNMAWYGTAATKESVGHLLGSMGFLIGVPVIGLALPLALEAISLKKHAKAYTIAASVMVLVGGALLRMYILEAGYFSFPWHS